MEPDPVDPRYSLANERTFLAWIRTSLGLLACAAGLLAIEVPWPEAAVRALAGVLAVTGGLSAFTAWHRWHRVEAAITRRDAIPTPRAHVLLAAAVAAVATAMLVLALL